MLQEIRVPDIGDFDEVEIVEVLVSAGDAVEADESLVTLESDKASMDIPAPALGEVVSMAVSVGDKVGEGDLIATLEMKGEAVAPFMSLAGSRRCEKVNHDPMRVWWYSSTPVLTSVTKKSPIALEPLS